MTATVAPAAAPQPSPAARGGLPSGRVLLIAGLIAALAIGFIVGRLMPRDASPQWVSGQVQVAGARAAAEVDGVSYGAVSVVPMWIDDDGVTNMYSWPQCFTDAAESGETLNVQVAVLPVSLDNARWGELIAVDCRG